MRALPHQLHHADRGRQHERCDDRYVDIGAPGAQSAKGRPEERTPGNGEGGNRNQRRQPVEECLGALRHTLRLTGPDRPGEHHDVGGGKAGYRQRAQELAPGPLMCGAQRAGVIWCYGISEIAHHRPDRFRVVRLPTPAHRQAPQGQIDARGGNRRILRKAAFNLPDAIGAVNAINQKFEPVLAILAWKDRAGKNVGDRNSFDLPDSDCRVRGHGRISTSSIAWID